MSSHAPERRTSAWRRLVPHWRLVLVLALAGAFALWLANYGIAR